ncbi:ArnT family glycosyltransferase [Mucilaginibacter ginkgonis]|uniref:Glycosyltransferase family 39 protein n=1 Tax=Mucilaginibacter ginkgonis TaxID=2682091 RepID=A0A7T7FAL2_9SPHI|nr:glycosyltransferase family 39 protein [Mucilaginibacter ginkgonis]QQL49807.1 glycosyltransferase family 39 protein [Mucilaginibacter ginkgonis]
MNFLIVYLGQNPFRLNISKRLFWGLVVLSVAVNVAGIGLPFFTDDPGLYASVAKQMLYHHDFLNLYTYGRDWLDKPHFPFWMAALSFQIFGISAWAYRLPVLLFFFGGIVYTYLFAKKFYGENVARTAVLIAMLTQHGIMSNTDVRAEPYLFGLLIGAIYHISNLKNRFSVVDLLAAAMLSACAVMTKGIFILIGIYGALLGELLFRGEFLSALKQFKYWALLMLTALFMFPEVWALYNQFDLHPERTVFGKQNFSGIKFFFWDSQFGRFFNSGPITRKSGSVFFFVHTLLWAFAPWCLLLYYALAKRFQQIIKRLPLNEYYTLCGSLILLLLFSVSGFQLPFYTNILFPLFAILAAALLHEKLPVAGEKYILITQSIYTAALPVATVLLNFIIAPGLYSKIILTVIVAVYLIVYFSRLQREPANKITVAFVSSCLAVIIANFYVTAFLYPQIVKYKGEIAAANFVNRHSAKTDSVYVFEDTNNIFQFYVNRPVKIVPLDQFSAHSDKQAIFYVRQEVLDRLRGQHVEYTLLKSFANYDNENVTGRFLNPKTRASSLVTIYLISH